MMIRGHFIGDAPYFPIYLRSGHFQGLVWLLADTGASRTTILDRDAKLLGIRPEILEPSSLPIVGIGGSVHSSLIRNVSLILPSDEGDVVCQQDIWIAQHDLSGLPSEETSRILRLPSILGRDLINRFRFHYDYKTANVWLER